MPSAALTWWRTSAPAAFLEIEAAHVAIGGRGPGRRYATGQVNNAYVVLLSSQFQRFCRDLHSEAAVYLGSLVPTFLRDTFVNRLTEGRKLDTGNPNPGNIGNDFARIGLRVWQQPIWVTTASRRRRTHLESLNAWRNAIAHHDFRDAAFSGRTSVQLAAVRRWRRSCDGLTSSLDRIVGDHVLALSGSSPW